MEQRPTGTDIIRGLLALALTVGVPACGGTRTAEPPGPGESYGAVPSLQGRTVMVIPVQDSRGVAGPVDPEIAFALSGRGTRVDWVLPDDMREALARSPGFRTNLDALPVGMFTRGRVRRVGDPLFGHLRRLAALTGGELALIPVRVGYQGGEGEAPGAVQIAAALLHAESGRVLWFGVVEGEPGEAGDPAGLASAADALARSLVW